MTYLVGTLREVADLEPGGDEEIGCAEGPLQMGVEACHSLVEASQQLWVLTLTVEDLSSGTSINVSIQWRYHRVVQWKLNAEEVWDLGEEGEQPIAVDLQQRHQHLLSLLLTYLPSKSIQKRDSIIFFNAYIQLHLK